MGPIRGDPPTDAAAALPGAEAADGAAASPADGEPLLTSNGAEDGPASAPSGLTVGRRCGIAGLCLVVVAAGATACWCLRGGEQSSATARRREMMMPPPNTPDRHSVSLPWLGVYNVSLPWLDAPSVPWPSLPWLSGPRAAGNATAAGPATSHNGTGVPKHPAAPAPANASSSNGTGHNGTAHNGTAHNGTEGPTSEPTLAPTPVPTSEPTFAPTPVPTVQPLDWFHPVDGGSGRSCRESSGVMNATEPGLPGSNSTVIEVASSVGSLEDCQSTCANASVCRAIEYDSENETCRVWSTEPESSVASKAATCLAYRPENYANRECPTTWQKPTPDQAWCSKAGENCLPSGCCEDEGLSCFKKDDFWASCKPTCEPGQIDVVRDLPEYQTPWSCKLLGCGNFPGRFVPPGRWESPPDNATQHNGKKLADVYIPGTGPHRVFLIGDWGGRVHKNGGCYISPANQVAKRWGSPFVGGVDDRAQFRVRDSMVGRAAGSQPDYVLNVGDNFYWAGVEEQCNSGYIAYMGNAVCGTSQFDLAYERVYNGEGLSGKQWLGVLGNHDWGGFRFDQGWDKQIGYTWTSPTGRWMTPALYYSAKVWYHDFAVDYIFMDTNIWDALDPSDPSPHNICSQYHNPWGASCSPGPSSVWDCPYFFKGLWEEQKAWLDDIVPGLDGDWRIVVTHFPPYWGDWDWKGEEGMARRHEIDLMITGHRHLQHIQVPGDPSEHIWPNDPNNLMSDFLDPTAYVVTGGGGGVTSELAPNWNGDDDQYGFMEMTLTKDTITLEAISHSGQTRKVSTINHNYTHKGSPSVRTAAA